MLGGMCLSRLCLPPILLMLLGQLPPTYLPAKGDDFYINDVRPLLQSKCVPCHGALREEANVRLDAGRLIHDRGIVDVRRPESSVLLRRVLAEDDQRMPPADEATRLSSAQIRILTEWVQSGAKWPTDEMIPEGPDKHWAYQPIRKPSLPDVTDTVPVVTDAGIADDSPADHPIDAFLQERRRSAGIESGPIASPALLVRRIYLDVLGLPPTLEQQQAFISGRQSWIDLVDALLSDPAYGQRWGRHWMDVWRYSDWDGFKQQVRGSQRHIWRWRDWIIESLNEDKPYDQMIVEMLAGDEVAPLDRQTWRATGFLARNYHNKNRDIWLDATVEHTGKAFLAMTMNCARCHDHKYDPLQQSDYFKMRAIFEPHQVRTERIAGQSNLVQDGIPRAFDADLDVETFLYHAGDEKHPDKDNPLQPSVPQLFDLPFDPEPVALPLAASIPDLRPFVQRESIAAAELTLEKAIAAEIKSSTEQSVKAREVAEKNVAAVRARWKIDRATHELRENTSHELSREVDSDSDRQPDLDAKLAKLRSEAIASEHEWRIAQAEATVLQKTAERDAAETSEAKNDQERKAAIRKAEAALKTAAKKVVELKATEPSTYTPIVKVFPSKSTGRRTALAKWITHPNHPLTARVTVNHIWMRHFGQPIVENVFDFGLRSPRPRHDQLLDWLAAELIQSRWSMKHLHRLILTSRAYRTAPPTDHPDHTAMRGRDPDNEYYWHYKPRRLEAEIVRDSILHVAGNLDLTHGGPDIDFQQGETVTRRSVYFRHAYEKQMTMLVTFDAANPADCYRRSPSVIPQQALALSNSPLATSQSRVLAGKLVANSESDVEFIHTAFATVLARSPDEKELHTCKEFLTTQTTALRKMVGKPAMNGTASATVPPSDDLSVRAKENLVHVLINHNDFVTVR